MAGKIEYKILKNMPYYNAHGQYFYNEENLDDFHEGAGVDTLIRDDDLYTIIEEQDCIENGYRNLLIENSDAIIVNACFGTCIDC